MLQISAQVNTTHDITKEIDGVISALVDAETGQRGFLLTGDEIFLDTYHNAYGRGKYYLSVLNQKIPPGELQGKDLQKFSEIFVERMNFLQLLIDTKELGQPISQDMMRRGKAMMDDAREISNRMQLREEALLKKRTDMQQKFAERTPVLIIIALLTALSIAIFSFIISLRDLKKKYHLHQSLLEKDRQTALRLKTIENIAAAFADGNYKIKLKDSEQDVFGSIAGSLNKMSESLDESFTQLKSNEWVQNGIVQLNQIMMESKEVPQLTSNIITFLSNYTQACYGNFYFVTPDKKYTLAAQSGKKPSTSTFEQEALQVCLQENGKMLFNEIEIIEEGDSHYNIIAPIHYQQNVIGILRLEKNKAFADNTKEFMTMALYNIGISLHSAFEHQQLQVLLDESNALSEALQKSTQYKSEFLANVSHELRTPLNSILLLSRLLNENKTKNLSSDQVKYAHIIETSGKSLLNLIDEILDLSKIEAGKMDIEVSGFAISQLVDNLSMMFTSLAQNKGLEMEWKVDDNVPKWIESDKDKLEQILRNFISNAIKFTKQGKVTLHIHSIEDNIHFDVKDSGIGISEDKQTVIFEAFQQADGSTRREYGGTGLGLSISKQLAHLLKGQIKVSSKTNVGSTFSLIIPSRIHGVSIPTSTPPNTMETKDLSNSTPDQITSNKNASKQFINIIVEPNKKHVAAIQRFLSDHQVNAVVLDTIELSKNTVYLTTPEELNSSIDKIHSNNKDHHFQIFVPSSWVGVLKNKYENIQYKAKPIYKRLLEHCDPSITHSIKTKVSERSMEALFGKVVLITDDDVRNIFSIGKILEQAGMKVFSATNGREALQKLTTNPTMDLVLLDMMMPEMDGYETVTHIRNQSQWNKLPVIAITANALLSDREKCLSLGCSDFLTKPIDADQMLYVIEQWLIA